VLSWKRKLMTGLQLLLSRTVLYGEVVVSVGKIVVETNWFFTGGLLNVGGDEVVQGWTVQTSA
jgi:hypothetical protein